MLSFTGLYTARFQKNMENALNNIGFPTGNPQTQIELQNQKMNTEIALQKYLQDGKIPTNVFLVAKYFEIKESKRELIKEIDNLKTFYMSQLIVNRIIEDALTPSIDNDFFRPSIEINGEKDESLSELVQEITEELSLKKIILDIASDVLYYGEAFLRLDVNDYNANQKGIINIHDDVDITSIVPVFRDSEVSYYLKFDKERKRIDTFNNTQFVYFHLPSNRIRVKIDGLDDKILYIRMGQSILYPVFGLLKELKFLEDLLPSAIVNQLKASKIVGVAVPPSTKAADAIEIARTYQKMVDNAFAKDEVSSDPDEVLKQVQSKIGSIKIIPVWNDKGDLRTQDIEIENNLEDIQQKIQDLRELILRTLGLPVNLITQDQDILKSDIIKSYNMYTRKLKMIQEALSYGLKQIYTIHLQNLGFTDITMKNVKIVWNNTLDYESLQRIELIDVLIASFDNIKSFINDIEGEDSVRVNKKDYVRYMNTQFKNIMGFDLLQYEEEEGL